MKFTSLALVASVILLPIRAHVQDMTSPSISLHLATLQDNTEAVLQHIAAGTDLDAKDAYGSTPLLIAATFGKTETANALIAAGADLEVTDNNGSTPLHIATFFCRTAIVEALIAHGADIYARNVSGSTPFDIAAPPVSHDSALYAQITAGLAPLGFELDYPSVKKKRSQLTHLLRPSREDLQGTVFTPRPDLDWKVSTPEAEGLDPLLVAELYYDAAQSPVLKSLLVIKNDKLIAEDYFNEGAIDHHGRVASVTKSFTSALTGIALEQGYLSDTDELMLDFFPEWTGKISDPRKQQITIQHMLQMRGGYPWEETDTALWNGLLTGRYVPLVEDFPLVNEPGAGFNYSNLTSNWLGIVLTRACSTDLRSFAQEHLFAPLGIEAGEWHQDWDGNYIGCGTLHVTARDMGKFGLLYLNGGMFDGKRVISEEWVNASLEDYSADAWIIEYGQDHIGRYFHDLGYGYQWWSASVGDLRFNFAWGHGGQFIVLLDDYDMIIVTQSYPFHLQHDKEAWKYEQGVLNLVGKFIWSLNEVM